MVLAPARCFIHLPCMPLLPPISDYHALQIDDWLYRTNQGRSKTPITLAPPKPLIDLTEDEVTRIKEIDTLMVKRERARDARDW